MVAAEEHDVRAGFFGHGEEPGVGAWIVHNGRVADDGAVGERGDGALEVQHLGDGDGDDGGAERGQDLPELADALGVGPAAPSDVDGVADLEDVPAVEGAGARIALTEQPSAVTTLSTSMVSGLRESAPGRVITATLRNMTTVSSTKTLSGQSSAGGTSMVVQPWYSRVCT